MSNVIVGLIAVVSGLVLCFGGRNVFRVILAVWGAFVGFTLGGALLSTATLLTVGAMRLGSSSHRTIARLMPRSLKLRIANSATVATAKTPNSVGPSKRARTTPIARVPNRPTAVFSRLHPRADAARLPSVGSVGPAPRITRYPPRAAARTVTTYSCCWGVMCGWIGKDRMRFAARSATGNPPRSAPSDAKAGVRWIGTG